MGSLAAEQRAVAAASRYVAHALGNLVTGLSLSLELLEGTALDEAQRRYLSRGLKMCRRLDAYQEALANLGGGGASAPVLEDTAVLLQRACAKLHLPADRVAVQVAPAAAQTFGRAALLHEALVALLRLGTDGLGDAGQLTLSARATAGAIELHLAASDRTPTVTDEATRGALAARLWAATIVEHVHGGTLAWPHHDAHAWCAVLTLPKRGQNG